MNPGGNSPHLVADTLPAELQRALAEADEVLDTAAGTEIPPGHPSLDGLAAQLKAAQDHLGTTATTQLGIYLPEHLLRLAWLRRMGPHALAGSTRRSGARMILSLALRPGGLNNSIEGIRLNLRSNNGHTHEVPQPVFKLYRKQWTLDLTFGIALDQLAPDQSWTVHVQANHLDQSRSDFEVRHAPDEYFAFYRYPLAPITSIPIHSITALTTSAAIPA